MTGPRVTRPAPAASVPDASVPAASVPAASVPAASVPDRPGAGFFLTLGGAAAAVWVGALWRHAAFVDPAIPLLAAAAAGGALAYGAADLLARRSARRRGRAKDVRRSWWIAGTFGLLAAALAGLAPPGSLYGFLPTLAGLVAVAAAFRGSGRLVPARLRPGRGREERLALTPAGVVTVCIAGALLLGAFLGPSNMLLLVCCLALGPLAADAYFAIATLRRCVPARRCPAIAAAGEVTLVELTLANRSRLPATQVVAADRLRNRTEDLAAPVRFSRVPPRATVTGVYRLRPMTRGRHALGPITLSTQFPLGLVRRESVRPAPGELLVLPLLGEMTAAWDSGRRNADELVRTAVPRRGLFEDEFYQLREYRPGDGPAGIHWRSSAKAGELMVREARESRDRDLALLLDLHAGGDPADRELVERAASAAATVVSDHLRRHGGATVSLRTVGGEPRRFAGRAGGGDPTAALVELALAEAGPAPAAAAESAAAEAAGGASPSARRVWVTTRPAAAVAAAGWDVLGARPGDFEEDFRCP